MELVIGYRSISYSIGKVCGTPPWSVAARLDSVQILIESPPPCTAGGVYWHRSIVIVAKFKDLDSN